MNYLTRPSERDKGHKHLVVGSGLPDFSWYISRMGKNTKCNKIIKWPKNIPSGRKIFQMAF
jgi:hypothetical protein